jgi:hypothetical protein
MFATVVVQREKQMTFTEFKSVMQSHKESAKTHGGKAASVGEYVDKAKFQWELF